MMPFDVEQAVRERYEAAANEKEAALCCPIDYDPKFLKILPAEIIDRDYGCGDPSKFVSAGETVLDLGSGGGKICYIASQIVGPGGRVIGIDTNREMLALAEKYRHEIGEKIGFHNTEFRYAKIQDLRLDLSLVDEYLSHNPIRAASDLAAYEAFASRLRSEKPLVGDESVDVVLSNCVLNLVREEDKKHLFAEMFRVLKRGGRAAISDIVADEEVPQRLRKDPDLWSGCISGAFREDAFLAAFEEAGFYGLHIVKRDERPWRVVEGIEFRSMTLVAYKGKEGICLERNQAVIYTGPWKTVSDDDGHTLQRGARMAVCEKSFQIFSRPPYAGDIIPLQPQEAVEMERAAEFDCRRPATRTPRETKGMKYDPPLLSAKACARSSCC